MRFLRSLYIHNQLYLYITIASLCFLISYWLPVFFALAWMVVITIAVLTTIDLTMLYGKKNTTELIFNEFAKLGEKDFGSQFNSVFEPTAKYTHE